MFALFVPISVQASHTLLCHEHEDTHELISLGNHFNETESDCCDIFHFIDKTNYFSSSLVFFEKHEITIIQNFSNYTEELNCFSHQKKSSRAPPVS